MAATDIEKIFQELVVPELREIKLEVRGLQTEIKRLDEKIDSFRNEMRTEIGSLRKEMRTEIRRLDEKIDIAIQIRERLSALESKGAVLLH